MSSGCEDREKKFFGQMNDKVDTNIMNSFNYNTNVNIGIEMYKNLK